MMAASRLSVDLSTPGGSRAPRRLDVLQRAAVRDLAGGDLAPPVVDEVLRTPGEPLEPATRGRMEGQLGFDLSVVRIHRDARASEAADHALLVERAMITAARPEPRVPSPARRTDTPRVLQRCSCGGASAATGECPECRRKRKLGLQAKLRVGEPGDRWEREAERLARRVSGGPAASEASAASVSSAATPTIHRLPSGQGAATAVPPVVAETLRSPGRPLDAPTRSFMEGRLGHDFSTVRIHTDARAAESARAVGARAYTVGNRVVFGGGEHRRGSRDGMRLLAHELVHTVQQSGDGGTTAATAATAPAVLQRQVPSPDPLPLSPRASTTTQKADRAEAICDIAGLCTLHFAHPDLVPDSRVLRVLGRCRPTVVSIASSPCLDPSILDPELFPPLTVDDTTGPAEGPKQKGAPKKPATGGAGLDDLLTLEYDAGPVHFTAKLPSSVRAKLPVEFRSSYTITFEVSASASGAFTFSVTLDGVPHVQFKSTTTANVADKKLKTELTIGSAAKTCHAKSPQATKKALEAAGEKLKTAIANVNKSAAQVEAEKAAEKTDAPVTPEPPEGFERTMRIVDVAKAIMDVKKAIDAAEKGCSRKPRASFGIGTEVPLDPSAPDALPPSFSAGLILRF